MPLQPLRFIHAANVLVDHQVRELGVLAPESKPIALTATVKNFERLIDACLDQSADFLLLTGGTFDEHDRSLKARIAMRDGFETLQDAGIQVFIVPGEQDSLSAWRTFGELPDNVTLFDPADDEPTAIMRDDVVIATLESCLQGSHGFSHEAPATTGSRLVPLRMGVIAPARETTATRHTVENWLGIFGVDYLAVGAEYGRLTASRGSRLGHSPGPAVPMTKRDLGPTGCSVVTIEESGQLTIKLLATSPLRREQFELQVLEGTTWDELMSLMRESLHALEPVATDPLLIADWTLKGTGSLFDSLQEPAAASELFELLMADTSFTRNSPVEHRLQLVPLTPVVPASAVTTLRSSNAAYSEPPAARAMFGRRFMQRLDETHAPAQAAMEAVHQKAHADAKWVERLEELLPRVDEAAVSVKARQLGSKWFLRFDEGQGGKVA